LAERLPDSPSTIKISHRAGSRSWQIGQLSGKPLESIAGFSPRQLARLACGFRARAASMHFSDDAGAPRSLLVEIFAQALVDGVLDGP